MLYIYKFRIVCLFLFMFSSICLAFNKNNNCINSYSESILSDLDAYMYLNSLDKYMEIHEEFRPKKQDDIKKFVDDQKISIELSNLLTLTIYRISNPSLIKSNIVGPTGWKGYYCQSGGGAGMQGCRHNNTSICPYTCNGGN